MILTQCAVCATELGLSLGKKCGRCSTRYCGPECQVQHWKDGGHDTLCKKIKKAGGAEQYNANKKYAEAVTVAAEACADDTKGQTCYICTQAVHWKTKEGLVRGCACRGTAGFAHVSCLAEQAKILVAEVEENNLGDKAKNVRWARWHHCSLCEQRHHGVVSCALGWACWKTYVGRPEADELRCTAIDVLGNGLCEVGHFEDAVSVKEAELSMERRLGASEEDLLGVQGNLAITYEEMGRLDEAIRMKRDVYSGRLKLGGEEDGKTLLAANNYASSLVDLKRCEEAKSLLRKSIPVARRVLGENDITTFRMRMNYGKALYKADGATLDHLREAVNTLEDTVRIARRIFGGSYPLVTSMGKFSQEARAALAIEEYLQGEGVESIRDAMAAMVPPGDA